jgi:hypothetical protein
MASHLPTSVPPRGSKRALVVLGIVGALAVALAGGWIYLWFAAHNRAVLEGTWRDTANPTHTYEFEPTGELAAWVGSKSWWNRLGWEATWRRRGQHITVRTDRNWDFEGDLDGDTIRGRVLFKNEYGAVDGGADAVWQRE